MANKFKPKAYGWVKIRTIVSDGEQVIKARVGSDSKLSRDMVTLSLIGNLSREEFMGLQDKAEFERDVEVRHPHRSTRGRKK